MKTLKEFLTEEYGVSCAQGYYECLCECLEVVFKDVYEEHRWCTGYQVVSKAIIDGTARYFAWYDWKAHGEDNIFDMGYELPDLDKDVVEVFPEEVTTIIYR